MLDGEKKGEERERNKVVICDVIVEKLNCNKDYQVGNRYDQLGE
jgi:hypothetical protein